MKWQQVVLILGLMGGLTLSAPAGIFSKKEAPKPTPAQRVPELLEILKSDPNDKKRESAAEELRQYDPKDFPEIVPALIDALQHDTKPDVRTEAAQTLGKLRPVTQEIGQALEQALANDSAYRVRWHVRMILWSYSHNGYKPTNKLDGPTLGPPPPPATAVTTEPPLASGPPVPMAPDAKPLPPAPSVAKPTPVKVSRPVVRPPVGGAPAPMPSGPQTEGPALTPPDEGPALTPP